jgi:hypothetical protein
MSLKSFIKTLPELGTGFSGFHFHASAQQQQLSGL